MVPRSAGLLVRPRRRLLGGLQRRHFSKADELLLTDLRTALDSLGEARKPRRNELRELAARWELSAKVDRVPPARAVSAIRHELQARAQELQERVQSRAPVTATALPTGVSSAGASAAVAKVASSGSFAAATKVPPVASLGSSAVAAKATQGAPLSLVHAGAIAGALGVGGAAYWLTSGGETPVAEDRQGSGESDDAAGEEEPVAPKGGAVEGAGEPVVVAPVARPVLVRVKEMFSKDMTDEQWRVALVGGAVTAVVFGAVVAKWWFLGRADAPVAEVHVPEVQPAGAPTPEPSTPQAAPVGNVTKAPEVCAATPEPQAPPQAVAEVRVRQEGDFIQNPMTSSVHGVSGSVRNRADFYEGLSSDQ